MVNIMHFAQLPWLFPQGAPSSAFVSSNHRRRLVLGCGQVRTIATPLAGLAVYTREGVRKPSTTPMGWQNGAVAGGCS